MSESSMVLETLNKNAMENNEQLNQASQAVAEGMQDVAATSDKLKKAIDSNEKKKIIKLIQSNLLPGKVRTDVKTFVPNASKAYQDDEELPEIEMAEGIEDEENDEDCGNFDFSNMTKLQLVEMLEETVSETDVQKIKDKVSSIRVRFVQINKEDSERELEQFLDAGGEVEKYKHIEDDEERRFNVALSVYKANKAQQIEQMEIQKAENLEKKNALIEELKELISSEESLKKTYDDFRTLQEQWKEIGPVPAAENTELWRNYHFLVQKFFDKVKIGRELRDLDMKKNLDAKVALCEKAEELLNEKSMTKAFKELQKLHEEWKEIGPVPQDKKDEIWERFKAATDQINKIRREHYAKLQEEQHANLEAKTALCEKIEELISELPNSINAWQKKSDEMNELFKVWRSLGPAPKSQNEEIWARFKGSMDKFYETKKVFFASMKEQQAENMERKVNLCIEAEALQESTDWKSATDRYKKLQEEWKTIGPVPRRHSDKLWKRFRAACDIFFNRKSEHFGSRRSEEEANLAAKRALLETIQAFELKPSRAENIEAIKALQKQWLEIGFVPIKFKDEINTEYRNSIDAIFDKMRISENELSTNEFKEMVEDLKHDPDSSGRFRKEKNSLSGKIQRLREEIAVLENNIGFFSNSKQSEIMKSEYEKKIKKAKSDLKLLETKMKILNE